MKYVPVLLSTSLLFSIISGSAAAAEPPIKLATPPASLEKWYKPANKRQVWLHTMFKLRREMQAIEEYSQQKNPAQLKKWITQLNKDYNKIAEMVPEWKKDIKPRLIPELETFTNKRDYPRINKTLKMISRTCKDCHQAYAPVVTAIYRSPGYDNIKVKKADGSSQSFNDNMTVLSKSVNRILIALKDGQKKTAITARHQLAEQLVNLGNSCSSCHKDDPYPHERILGQATKQKLTSLEENINQWRVKPSQELMGKLAVTVCARCHNTHRITSDLRGALLPPK